MFKDQTDRNMAIATIAKDILVPNAAVIAQELSSKQVVEVCFKLAECYIAHCEELLGVKE